jgi:uncharacterized protein (TIGR00297 family)
LFQWKGTYPQIYNLMQIFTGIILGIMIAAVAWRLRALSTSGALAAALTGGLIYGFGGLAWAALLLAFFISSSALSAAFKGRKTTLGEKFAKGSRRDMAQVLANGGLGTLLVVAHALIPEQSWPWFAYAGAMAAVNADTWATELGVLSSTAPRLITSGKWVERGSSGGITLLGSLASLGGAIGVGLVGAAFTPGGERLPLVLAAAAGGLLGSLFDSFLGASVQAIYFCPVCQKETERHPRHTCGAQTTHLRGWRWLNNEVVNFLCSLVGALVALGLWLILL